MKLKFWKSDVSFSRLEEQLAEEDRKTKRAREMQSDSAVNRDKSEQLHKSNGYTEALERVYQASHN